MKKSKSFSANAKRLGEVIFDVSINLKYTAKIELFNSLLVALISLKANILATQLTDLSSLKLNI